MLVPYKLKQSHFVSSFFWMTAIMVTLLFFWMLSSIIGDGFQALSWEFIFDNPSDSGRSGGIAPILISTVLILLICSLTTLPLAIATAFLIAEFIPENHFFSIIIKRSLDILASIPSIVYGLFGNIVFCKMMGLGFSILSGGLTLACMILPILILTSEQTFRSISKAHRQGSEALALSKFTTLFQVYLPCAIPALTAGFILGLGRATAETAALIFTSGYVDRMPDSVMDSGRALSIHIYDLTMNVPGGSNNAYGTALLMIIILLITNSSINWLTQRWNHNLTAQND
ncbi:MAG: phosphate ABC transporter permease PstA [Methylococcales bacterium]|nr:phosphate ABC transporter permease PstA [Methylococcales bacterium]MBT7410986.1 phosphate ABC transporter permease PstA [Methylococcales bacterium]